MKSQTGRWRWETNHCVMYADSLKSIIYNWKMVPSQIKLKIRDRNINRPCTGHARLTHVSGCKSRTSRVRNLGSSTRFVYCVLIKYLILKEYVIDLKQQRKNINFHQPIWIISWYWSVMRVFLYGYQLDIIFY